MINLLFNIYLILKFITKLICIIHIKYKKKLNKRH